MRRNQIKRKITSIMLVLVMMLTLLPTMPVYAATELTVGAVGSGATYNTMATALAAVQNGDTIKLLSNITECVDFTTTAGTNFTIDGDNGSGGRYTITASGVPNQYAVILRGAATVTLKDLVLQGGAGTGNSAGLYIGGTCSVDSIGTVDARGGDVTGNPASSYGLISASSGTVEVTNATGGKALYGWSYGLKTSGNATVVNAIGGEAQRSFGAYIESGFSGKVDVVVTNATGGTGEFVSTGMLVYSTSAESDIRVQTATGGDDCWNSIGLDHQGNSVVNVQTATGGRATQTSAGVRNYADGTINVDTATSGTAGISSTGVILKKGSYPVGTINVRVARAGNTTGSANAGYYSSGIANTCEGVVNAEEAYGGNCGGANSYGVYNTSTGIINVTSATTGTSATGSAIGVCNGSTGTINVETISGSTDAGTGVVNTGADITAVTLMKEVGATCVLSEITVAAAGTTTVKTLPSVYQGSVEQVWCTDVARQTLFSGTTVNGAMTLYSGTPISGTPTVAVTNGYGAGSNLIRIGATLTATANTTPNTNLSYQWQVSTDGSTGWTNATGVGNATNTYTVDGTDAGKYIRVGVSSSDAAGTMYSAASTKVPYTITLTLTGNTGTDAASFASGSVVTTTYALPNAMLSLYYTLDGTGSLSNTMSHTDASNPNTTISTSAGTGSYGFPASSANAVNGVIAVTLTFNHTNKPNLTGTPTFAVTHGYGAGGDQIGVGSTLTATANTAPNTNLFYQWQVSANGVDGWANATGTGKTTSAYTVASDDSLKYLRVAVTSTDGVGTVYSVASAKVPSDVVYVGGTDVIASGGVTYWLNDGLGGITSTGANASNYNVCYDPTTVTPTLTLSGAAITGSTKSFYELSRTFVSQIYSKKAIKVTLVGSNSVTGSVSGVGEYNAGLFCESTMEINGTGSLAVQAGHAMSNCSSSGVFARNGLTISGNPILQTAGGVADAPLGSSYGIIVPWGNIIIQGGIVTATGKTQAMGDAPDLSGYSNCGVIASTSENGSSPTAYAGASISSYQYVSVQPKTVSPVVTNATVTKTSSPQKSVEFTLTTNPSGVYRVYADSTTATVHSSATVAVTGAALILTDSSANLAGGLYYVGVTEAGKMESTRLVLTVNGPALVPSATFALDGANANKLMGTTTQMIYSINGGGAWTTCSAVSTNLTAFVATLSASSNILVRDMGDGAYSTASNPQTIDLTQAATPNLTATQPIAVGGTGSIPMTAVHEYSADGGITWTTATGTTDLAPDTYLVRVAGIGTVLASASQTIVITAYTPPSGGGGGGSASGPITRIDNGGSVTDSNIGKLVTGGKTLTVDGADGSHLVFDTESLKGIEGQATGTVKVEMKDVSPEHQEDHPGKIVFSLSVTSGTQKVTNFGGAVAVSLPYELQDGETADLVTVWYLADDGSMTEIPCVYDPVTKLATFTVTHFSLYMVGVETEEWNNPFADVKENDWFYNATAYASEQGLMQGTGTTTFGPNDTTTRGMLVTILWRMENQPKTSGTMTFRDVSGNAWYANAVAWASTNSIVSGYGNDFRPNDALTREQLSAILYRYAAYKGYDVSKLGDLSSFQDSPSSWAKQSMQWAVAEGYLTGTSAATLSPTAKATRAQIASILMRFLEDTKAN